MDSRSENPLPDMERFLRDLSSACERIATSLEKMESLYAFQVKVNEKLRQEAEEGQKEWKERQKKWEEDDAVRTEQNKQLADTQRQFEEAQRSFITSMKPEKWQMQILWLMIALILLGLLKASVVYLFGYWPVT